jgi:hypothetical protein
MTDLRTRIAAATFISHRDRKLAQLGMKPSEYAADIPIPDWAYADADAVIAQLGLREERRGPVTAYRDGQYYPDCSLVRFISDWETRDD